MKNKYKLMFLTILSLTLVMLIFPMSMEKVSSQKEIQIPILVVTKLADKEIVDVNEWFRVIIRIKNIGNATAYNVTLQDSIPPDWGVRVQGVLQVHWAEVPPGAEIMHTYNVSIQTVSTYTAHLGYATVTYYDSNGERYVVFSEDLEIIVRIKSGRHIEWEEIWRNVAIMESIIILILVTPLIIIEYRIYRDYKRELSKGKQ